MLASGMSIDCCRSKSVKYINSDTFPQIWLLTQELLYPRSSRPHLLLSVLILLNHRWRRIDLYPCNICEFVMCTCELKNITVQISQFIKIVTAVNVLYESVIAVSARDSPVILRVLWTLVLGLTRGWAHLLRLILAILLIYGERTRFPSFTRWTQQGQVLRQIVFCSSL